jgi:hypothetical protein
LEDDDGGDDDSDFVENERKGNEKLVFANDLYE